MGRYKKSQDAKAIPFSISLKRTHLDKLEELEKIFDKNRSQLFQEWIEEKYNMYGIKNNNLR